MPAKQPAIYIMANRCNGTSYIGVTSDLIKRVYEHKYADVPGFTQKYGCNYLVYYEIIADMISAIAREKQLKGGSSPHSAVNWVIMTICFQPTKYDHLQVDKWCSISFIYKLFAL